MALLLALAVNVGVATMVESFSRPSSAGSTDGSPPMSISAPPTTRRRTRSRHWLRDAARCRRSCRAAAPRRKSQGQPVEVLGLPDHATYREHWPLLQLRRDAWTQLRAGRCRLHQRAIVRGGSNSRVGDRIEVPAPGGTWPLDDRRHLCRLRQPQGPARGQLRGADPAFSATCRKPGSACASRRARSPALIAACAEAIRPRRPQPRRPGDGEGGIEAHLQPHLCGHRGAECLHARRRRHRAADQPAHARAIRACRSLRRSGRSASRGRASRRSS